MQTRKWPDPTEAEKDRFFSRIEKSESCHLWQAGKSSGYGAFSWRNRPWHAHRLYMVWSNDCVDYPDLCVRHSCHIRDCVRPDHLSWGTAFDNKQDSIKDKRYVFGEKVHAAKLCAEKARIIFCEYHQSVITMEALARKYSISVSVISGIVNRTRWAEATEEVACLAADQSVKDARQARMIENLKKSSPTKTHYSKEQVVQLWKEYHSSEASQVFLSKKYNIHKIAVSRILRRVIWRHATEGLPEIRKERGWTPFGKN